MLISLDHLCKSFDGVEVLRDITFEAASVSLLKICAITVVCVCVAVGMFRRRV